MSAGDLPTLLTSGHPIVLLKTHEEDRAFSSVKEAAVRLKLPLFDWSITQGLRAVWNESPIYHTEKPAAMLAHVRSNASLEALYFLRDFQPYLDDSVVVRLLRELAGSESRGRTVFVLCGPDFKVPETLEKEAILHDFAPPGRAELLKLLHDAVHEANKLRKVEIAITKAEYDVLGAQLEGMTFREARRIIHAVLRDSRLSSEDVREILKHKQRLVEQGGILEFVSTPASLAEIGGLARLKEWLTKRQKAFTPQAREMGLAAPKGVLLLGVQGCGKSLCAKAFAAAWGMPLLRLDPASLYDKYIGETEKSLKKALSQAEGVAPAVLWIDEIEKALEGGGGDSSDGGLSRRVLGSFLFWMQEKQRPVFVVATANDISRLPPELLRKGRFDEIFFVDLPGPGARELIFRIHLDKRRLDAGCFDLAALAKASEGFSGAEIEQAVVDALYEVLNGRLMDTPLLLQRLAATRPLSVVMAEKVEELRDWARERTVPAD